MTPSIVVCDNFYSNPVGVRERALKLDYTENSAFYKGKRCTIDEDVFHCDPNFRESTAIADLLDMDYPQDWYSCFQLTTEKEPLVYHSDHQRWAGAVYLEPSRTDAGTSFWKNKDFGHRRPSDIGWVNHFMYSPYNLTHPDRWELVDRVGSVFNRLVLWDAQLIHSATTYEGFTDENPRLVQLFFFN